MQGCESAPLCLGLAQWPRSSLCQGQFGLLRLIHKSLQQSRDGGYMALVPVLDFEFELRKGYDPSAGALLIWLPRS
jgi:hypothetical protein